MAVTTAIRSMQSKLTIWQQNLNKSQMGQHDLIRSGNLAYININIVAIQEPAMNFLDKMIATRDWIPIYPSTHKKGPKKTQSLILMSSRLLSHSGIIIFPSHSSFITYLLPLCHDLSSLSYLCVYYSLLGPVSLDDVVLFRYLPFLCPTLSYLSCTLFITRTHILG